MTHKENLDLLLSQVPLTNKTCYGYARVSTVDQAIMNLSIPAQERECLRAYEYRFQPQGYTWGGMYVDPGISGKVHLSDRKEGGRKLVTSLRRGDMVITLRGDRLFRNNKDMINTVSDWIDQGIGCFIAENSLEVSNKGSGMMVFSILAAVAENERRTTAERTREALFEKRMRGERLSHHIPLGFRLSGKFIVPDNAERVVMGKVLGWHEQGASVDQIHFFLREANARRTTCGTFWSKSQISRVPSEERKLREIQRRVLARELDRTQVPAMFLNMEDLPACANLFPYLQDGGDHA